MVLDKFRDNVIKLARNGLKRSAQRAEERLKQNAGLTDHSLDQLKDAKYPYSKRHPQFGFHKPFELLHIQSGQLRNSIRIVEQDQNTMAIGVDPSVPYLTDVIEGTALLYPRNFPLMTLRELEENKVIEKTMESAIEEAIKRS